jgi:hypothetical protein
MGRRIDADSPICSLGHYEFTTLANTNYKLPEDGEKAPIHVAAIII